MKNIKIEITKARLESFTVSVGEDGELNVHTTIGLYTEQDKKISSFSLSSDSWNDSSKFEIPLKSFEPIREIIDELETLTTLKCRDGQKLLA